MRFLVFADLHQFDVKNIDKIQCAFDTIVFLGDIDAATIRYILSIFPNNPAYAVLGNHDSETLFQSVNRVLDVEMQILGVPFLYPLKNINLCPIYFEDVSFVGFQGSVKYKEKYIGYTQEHASSLIIPDSDILFSHETGYHFIAYDEYNIHHEGFCVISDYIKEKMPKYHIFGHHHKDIQFAKNTTFCFGVYGCSVFDYNSGEVNNPAQMLRHLDGACRNKSFGKPD